MFDNVAFEVVIGLVFIYLLYSLLVTILGEIVSTFLGIRARLLRAAIERMLNDGYHYSSAITKKPGARQQSKNKNNRLTTWRRAPALTEHPDFSKSLAGKFYNYPAIKYLGKIETQRRGKAGTSKPSYISADYFADSLINFLADKGSGFTQMEKINFCLAFNTYHIQPETRQQLLNLFESAATIESYKANLMKWFNETMDRTSGWHKRKMRVISFLLGLVLAMSFNIDTIKIAKILANDKEARAQLVDMGIATAKDSSRYREFVTGNGDTVHSRQILDTGFARIKNDINAAGLVLGLGWDFSAMLKVDEEKMDSKNGAFAFLQQQAQGLQELEKRRQTLTRSLKDSSIRLSFLQQQLDSLYADTTLAIIEAINPGTGLAGDSNARLQADRDHALLLSKQRDVLSARMKMDSAGLRTANFLQNSLKENINQKGGIKFAQIDSAAIKNNVIHFYGKRPYKFFEKAVFVFSHMLWFSLAGFIITALALSMGAPFWFDLLNKLVSIRGVGVKPEEKKQAQFTETDLAAFQRNALGTIAKPVQEPVEDVIEAALQMYASQLKAIPGVKAVFSLKKNGKKLLQVNVNDAGTKAEVKRQFPQLSVGEVVVPYSIVVSGTPATQSGAKGMIANRSGKNGFGSLGCIVRRRSTGSKHILSCWHVLKGDLDYSVSDGEPFIVDHTDGKELGERWAGGIRDQFDYGLARCADDIAYKDNSFLGKKLGIGNKKFDYRFVSRLDVENQIAIKFYDGLNNAVKSGFIYTDSEEVDISYIDKTRTVKDVLILTNDNEETISSEGNSGALVFDEANMAIAMIIGGDLKYTYAVKLSHIFRIHSEMEMT